MWEISKTRIKKAIPNQIPNWLTKNNTDPVDLISLEIKFVLRKYCL